MRIASIFAPKFRRFEQLRVSGLPATAKLIVVIGPNGSGKSAVFDALNLWYRQNTRFGHPNDIIYFGHGMTKEKIDHSRDQTPRMQVDFHDLELVQHDPRLDTALHIRSAYRHEPDFTVSQFGSTSGDRPSYQLDRLIDADRTVARNYQHLVLSAVGSLFSDLEVSNHAIRDELVGRLSKAFSAVFPDLALDRLGQPEKDGTFYFTKGSSEHFHYKNLSAGEKAVFDLLLDLQIQTCMNPETIYVVDEPEVHTNAAVQRVLLRQMLDMIPEQGQLWIATHSHSMLSEAKSIYELDHGSVAFLNFFDKDFDVAIEVQPEVPNRKLWNRALRDSLDELADLVAPKRIVFCEGASALNSSKDGDDAVCYSTIFAAEFPDVAFISLGSSSEITKAALGLQNLIVRLTPSTKIKHLHDRDEMNDVEIEQLKEQGGLVLNRRELESYLWGEEVLVKFLVVEGHEVQVDAFKRWYAEKLSTGRTNPTVGQDEVKDFCGEMFLKLRKLTRLPALGSNHREFMKQRLAPLVTPETVAYQDLKVSIFAPEEWS